jgi:hypothetical protein
VSHKARILRLWTCLDGVKIWVVGVMMVELEKGSGENGGGGCGDSGKRVEVGVMMVGVQSPPGSTADEFLCRRSQGAAH